MATTHERRRFPWVIVLPVLAVVVLGVVLLLWWRLWQGGVAIGPVEGNLSRIESRHNSSSSMSSTGGTDRRLNARRILIMADGDHPLLLKVVPLVRDELAKLPFVEEVQTVPYGEHLPAESRLPDLLVRMALPQIDETNTLHERTLNATFAVRAGTGLHSSNHSYTDNLTPPVVSVNWDGKIDHKSTSVGDGVGAERYRLTAPAIAKEVAAKLASSLKGLHEKHGALPPLAEAFHGQYRPWSSDLAAIPQAAAPPVFSGYGLLRHNETLWEFQSDKIPADLLGNIRTAMQAHGWKGGSVSDDPYLRMHKGPAVLTVYAPREDSSAAASVSPPAGQRYHIHYIDRFSAEEVSAAVRSVLDTADIEHLLGFKRQLDAELRQALIQKLEAMPMTSGRASLLLAEHYRSSDTERAARHLRHAAILNIATGDDSSAGRIDALVKQLKQPKPRLADVSADDLGAMEIPELTASTPLTRTLNPDEPLVAFAQDGDGKVRLISLKITASGDPGPSPWVAVCSVAEDGGRSSMRSGGHTNPAGQWFASGSTGFGNLSVPWTATQQPDGRFEVTVTAQE